MKITIAFAVGATCGAVATGLIHASGRSTPVIEAAASAPDSFRTVPNQAAGMGAAPGSMAGGATTSAKPGPPSRATAPATLVHLQQAVTTSLNADSLSRYQPQLERWTCRTEGCDAALRLPATVDASRTHDMRAVSDILATLQQDLTEAGMTVGLSRVAHDPEGMGISFHISPADRERLRTYTDAQIAEIRHDTLLQYLDHAPSAPRP